MRIEAGKVMMETEPRITLWQVRECWGLLVLVGSCRMGHVCSVGIRMSLVTYVSHVGVPASNFNFLPKLPPGRLR